MDFPWPSDGIRDIFLWRVELCNTIAIDISCFIRLDYVCLWYYLIHVVLWLTHYIYILKFNYTSCACLSCYLQKELVSIVGSYCTLSLKNLVATLHMHYHLNAEKKERL